ncbi:hypothetical protein BUY43_10700 [Staphylococcus devriesei]|uniref:Uncharacterized protein n=1 Tax=Staphylococcus devriesei TaxID=586733 RepID=A0A2K4DFE6_9STAP|nr:hypothetical protein [Staphylococcus devriesei]MCE5096603.1 hypothetical protein [Staphylococcus devriesei]PNZ85565.1 hypothetical protein CD147_11355 [Staphylococcus devriesei]PTF01573.1 hypothetical protein BUY45_11310 [Staphylococcus devriesei]PTF11784.1 hypothetical protein BUY48_10200 [Staphylococcus devriesei]PTF14757.1 hypothetical protein BUY47_04905 [Staphylococcus devriesei]
MNNWKINNHSQRRLIIQENNNEISIVEPLDNGSFRILAEINLNTQSEHPHIYDDTLFVSTSKKNEELNIFDKTNS